MVVLLILLLIMLLFHSNLKKKIAGRTANGGSKDIKIMVPLKYLINFLEDPNFELCRMF